LKEGRRKPDVITFTSSSTARNFVSLLELNLERGSPCPAFLDGVKLASIGPVTSETLRELGLPVDIEAREYTIPGLVEAILAGLA
jgi:uroporphyrinogen III methyltransferase/synthase